MGYHKIINISHEDEANALIFLKIFNNFLSQEDTFLTLKMNLSQIKYIFKKIYENNKEVFNKLIIK